MTPPEIVAVALLGFVVLVWGGSFVMSGPIGKAIARRIGGEAADESLRSDLEAALTEVDGMRMRVQELEERVDFAERLLAQGRELPQLPDVRGVS